MGMKLSAAIAVSRQLRCFLFERICVEEGTSTLNVATWSRTGLNSLKCLEIGNSPCANVCWLIGYTSYLVLL